MKNFLTILAILALAVVAGIGILGTGPRIYACQDAGGWYSKGSCWLPDGTIILVWEDIPTPKE